MLCYKNRWWCRQEDCKNFGAACDRSYTIEVMAAASRWWGSDGAPVQFADNPECYDKKST